MALAETTLSAAVTASAKKLTVASATSVAAGRLLQVDGEIMLVDSSYVTASTTVPLAQRGLYGSAAVSHLNTARVIHGAPSDFPAPGAGAVSAFSPVGRPRRIRSYRTTASMDLPAPGEDLLVRLDSTAFTLTVPVPSKDLDGSEVTFVGSTGAAYVLEFTGGLGGASTSYETITFNATGNLCFKVIAMNETWNAVAAIPVSGTVTNVTAGLG